MQEERAALGALKARLEWIGRRHGARTRDRAYRYRNDECYKARHGKSSCRTLPTATYRADPAIILEIASAQRCMAGTWFITRSAFKRAVGAWSETVAQRRLRAS